MPTMTPITSPAALESLACLESAVAVELVELPALPACEAPLELAEVPAPETLVLPVGLPVGFAGASDLLGLGNSTSTETALPALQLTLPPPT